MSDDFDIEDILPRNDRVGIDISRECFSGKHNCDEVIDTFLGESGLCRCDCHDDDPLIQV